MKWNSFLMTVVGAVLFFSCEQKVKDEVWKDDSLPKLPALKDGGISDYEYILSKVEKIESKLATDYSVIRSLRWEYSSDSVGEAVEILAFFDTDGFPVKIVEDYYEQAEERKGEKTFYYEKEQLIFSENIYDQWKDVEGGKIFADQFFYEQDELVYVRHKEVDEVSDLEKTSWEETDDFEKISAQRATEIIQQLPPYRTHFLSIIESNNALFLLLGEPKDGDRFVTTLKVEDKTVPFIQDLLRNRKEYRYRPLMVQFDIVGGDRSPEYRVIKGAKWVDYDDDDE